MAKYHPENYQNFKHPNDYDDTFDSFNPLYQQNSGYNPYQGPKNYHN